MLTYHYHTTVAQETFAEMADAMLSSQGDGLDDYAYHYFRLMAIALDLNENWLDGHVVRDKNGYRRYKNVLTSMVQAIGKESN